jgi:30S ribosomal protein S31
MGKGDKKSKRGKIILGSYGVSRPRVKSKPSMPKKEKPEDAEVKVPVKAAKPKTVKKSKVAEKPAAESE